MTLIFEGLIVSKFLNYETVNRKKCWTANPDSYILYRTIQNIGKKQSMEASPTQRTAKPELEKAGVYLGLQQPEVNQAASSSASTSKQSKVTASTSRRGQKKTNEQQQ